MANEVTMADVKAAFDAEAKLNDEFRKTNDQRLRSLEVKGHGDPLFDEKLDKINEEMNRLEKIQANFRKQQDLAETRRVALEDEKKTRDEEWIRKIEGKVNRSLLGLGGSEIDATLEERANRKAYNAFLRKGIEKMSPDEAKVLVVSNDTTGGYLAPPTFAAEIIKAEVLFSPMRTLVTVRQIGSGEYQQPKRTQTAAAVRAGEVTTRAESQNPAWGLMKIGAPELYAEARVTWANLEDSAFNLESLLTDEFAEQFGVKEGAEVISGNGVNSCLGILDAAAAGPATPVAYTKSGVAATIASAAAGSAGQGNGLLNLYHQVKTAYASRGTWILNRASLGKVRLIQDTTGQYLWQPGLASASPPTILGAPYVECPDMPDEGANAFPIAFGDWKRAYTLVERVDMVVTRDPYTIASSGQVKFFARRRVGGQIVLGEAVRLYKCEA